MRLALREAKSPRNVPWMAPIVMRAGAPKGAFRLGWLPWAAWRRLNEIATLHPATPFPPSAASFSELLDERPDSVKRMARSTSRRFLREFPPFARRPPLVSHRSRPSAADAQPDRGLISTVCRVLRAIRDNILALSRFFVCDDTLTEVAQQASGCIRPVGTAGQARPCSRTRSRAETDASQYATGAGPGLDAFLDLHSHRTGSTASDLGGRRSVP